jgi:hypothetical protein
VSKPTKKSPKKKATAAASKKKKTKHPPVNHPHYRDMIKDALTSLKERGGSSRQAIFLDFFGDLVSFFSFFVGGEAFGSDFFLLLDFPSPSLNEPEAPCPLL